MKIIIIIYTNLIRVIVRLYIKIQNEMGDIKK
jgi:hypothetical protein